MNREPQSSRRRAFVRWASLHRHPTPAGGSGSGRAACLLAAGTLLVGCAAGSFRYDRLDEKRDGVELRELEDLVADGVRGPVRAEQVEYDFKNERDEYVLGRNDVLAIFVMDHPEMSSQRVNLGEISGTTIRKDGHVYLPVVGKLGAAGLTLTQFEHALRERAATFVVNPQVSVEILEHASQKFHVLGSVRNPGTFPVDGDTTLLEALSLAGGTDDDGNIEAATVVRAGELMPINLGDLVKRGDVSRNVYMRAGDVVYVPDGSQDKVYVLGEVQTPKVVPIEQGRMTLAEALAAAGGPTPARARRELAVIRGGYAKPIVYRLDLEKALVVDDQVLLRPGDRVVVAPTGLSTASRYMQQILPFLMGAQAIGLAAQGGTNVATQAAAMGEP
jgi:polysaccharide export outer membrane protein